MKASSIQIVRFGHILPRLGQKQSSRFHELEHNTEHHNRDEHQHQSRNDLGERVQTVIRILGGALETSRRSAMLTGQSASQAWECKALSERELVDGFG